MENQSGQNPASNAPRRGRPRKTDKPAPPKPSRRHYGDDLRAEAKDLYVRGVTIDRIARYLGAPMRTLTNWQTVDRWNAAKNPRAVAEQFRKEGLQVAEIADRLDVSAKTVRAWLKADPADGEK